jgi:hypothetical protein
MVVNRGTMNDYYVTHGKARANEIRTLIVPLYTSLIVHPRSLRLLIHIGFASPGEID